MKLSRQTTTDIAAQMEEAQRMDSRFNAANAAYKLFWRLNEEKRATILDKNHVEALDIDAVSATGNVYKSAGASLLLTTEAVYMIYSDTTCRLVSELVPSQIITDTNVFTTEGERRTLKVIPGPIEEGDFPLDGGDYLSLIFLKVEQPPAPTREAQSLDVFIETRDSQYLGRDEVKMEDGKVWRKDGGEWVLHFEDPTAPEVYQSILAWIDEEMDYHHAQQRNEIAVEAAVERYYEEGHGYDAFQLEDEDRRLGRI